MSMRLLMSTDTVGGVWHYALELARGLAAYNVQVTLAALGRPPNAEQRRAAAAVPELQLYHHECPLEWMQDPWPALAAAGDWLLELERRATPDIIHLNHYCHGDLPWSAPVLMVSHSCVYSWHRWVRQRPPGPLWHYYRDTVRRGLQTANMVVAPSGAMLAEAERYYGPFRQARVIANGRRPEEFVPAVKQPLIVCAGRLWDEAKNAATLARIAPRLSWPVEIIGDSTHPDGGSVSLPNVSLPGPLSRRALARRLAVAGIYALPARYEPFGLSALEAALAGCALVLGDIPSLREVWSDTALFVPPADGEALAGTLQSLIDDPQLRQAYAARAGTRAHHFSAERMTRDYLRNYRALLRNRTRVPIPVRRRAGSLPGHRV